ncbi:Gfo/Idh/MocA family protein [Streptomyces sp. NPDC003032]
MTSTADGAAPVRFGVIGCADIARRRMLPAMAAEPGIELVAVASRDAARARETAEPYGCGALSDYRELIELSCVDAVYVPLPIALHSEWVAMALEAGKHVLAEKPLTDEPEATARLLRLARERDRVLMENVMFVHHPVHAAVRRLVDEGAIGELRSFNATFTIPEPAPGDIRYNPDLGGGALLDIGYYPVRGALHFLGDRLEVAGAVLSRGPGRRIETSGAAVLHRTDGVFAQLDFGMAHAYRSSYELCGSSGRIRVGRAFTPPADRSPAVVLERAGAEQLIDFAPADQVTATLRAFCGAIRTGEGVDGATVLAQAGLLAAIRSTASQQR